MDLYNIIDATIALLTLLSLAISYAGYRISKRQIDNQPQDKAAEEIASLKTQLAVLEERLSNELEALEKVEEKIEAIRKCL